MNKQKKAFTLVELIVVITILAILWTIAFISLQWYSKDTRNSVRLSDLLNIDKTLWIKLVTAWKVPVPDNKIDITASGTIFIYQWNAWERVLDSLWVSNWWKDPKDETYYTYATNVSLNKYQIIWFMEWDAIASNSLIDNSYAVTDLTDRSIITKWDELWILLDATTNVPLVNWVDVATTTTSYKAIFEEDILVEGTGWVLFSNYYNRDKGLLADKELAKLDDSLVWYWDMETLTWWLLKDFSQYWNNGECKDAWIVVVCWSSSWAQLIEWSLWLAMNFDWIDDTIDIPQSSIFDLNDFTVVAIIKHSWAQEANDWWWWRIVSSQATDFMFFRINDSISWDNVTPSIRWSLLFWVKWAWIISSNNTLPVNLDVLDWAFHSLIYTKDSLLKTYNNWLKVIEDTNNTGLISVNEVLRIWWYWTASEIFDWIIDEVRIYNRALSDNEVKTLYEATK